MLYKNIISKFPKTYKVYLNISYKNKAKDLGAKWDYLKKQWYYTEETKLGVINKLNYLSYPKPRVYNVKISIHCKDDLKQLGLHLNNNDKLGFILVIYQMKTKNLLKNMIGISCV